MSSSSNLQYEEIPKKYIDPLAPKDKGKVQELMGKIENKERCFSCKDFGSGFENKEGFIQAT